MKPLSVIENFSCMILKVKDLPSPNFSQRPPEMEVDVLVLHYTGMRTGREALSRLCDAKTQVSSHYVVEEDGQIFRLVPEDKQAWHAGISCWNGKAALNENSIGIEIVNPGHEYGYRPFPQVQMDAVLELTKNITSRYNIAPHNVVGHSDIAPMRKQDPGELFDWKYLARHGVGLWVDVGQVRHASKLVASLGDESLNVATIQKMLLCYGYHIRVDGLYGEKTESVIRAFKRHHIQDDLGSFWDNRSQATLEALLAKL